MTRLEERVQVEAPVRTVYDQWTQFEEFPRFMSSVDRIRQLDDTHLHWTVDLGGRKTEFEAEITEQIPDARIAWKSTSGPDHAGAVDFHRLNDAQTEISVVMDVALPATAAQVPGSERLLQQRLRSDLDRFKQLIEQRGQATGGWRGEVRPDGSGRAASPLGLVREMDVRSRLLVGLAGAAALLGIARLVRRLR